jgi:hypothetical protein
VRDVLFVYEHCGYYCTAKLIRVLIAESPPNKKILESSVSKAILTPELIHNVWACDASGIHPFQRIEKFVHVRYAFLLINISSRRGLRCWLHHEG